MAGSGLLISTQRKLNWIRLIGLITQLLLIWKWMGLFLRKNHFKMLGLTFCFKLDWSSYIICIVKAALKKIWVLIRTMKFLSPEAALYLYKSAINLPIHGIVCHIWPGAPSYFLELSDKLQKRVCRIVGPSLAASWTFGLSSKCSQPKSFLYLLIW